MRLADFMKEMTGSKYKDDLLKVDINHSTTDITQDSNLKLPLFLSTTRPISVSQKVPVSLGHTKFKLIIGDPKPMQLRGGGAM